MALHPGESRRRAALANALRSQTPPLPDPTGPARPPRALDVFGVGTDCVQLCWRALGPGPVTVEAGAATVDVDADGGPGAVTLRDVGAGAELDVVLRGPGLPGDGPLLRRAELLPRPAGALLTRIATVNDVHLGSASTGFLHTIIEKPEPEVPHPLRCGAAALDEAEAWGAEHLVVKGDLVDVSKPDHWERAGRMLADRSFTLHGLLGNHERSRRSTVDATEAAATIGLPLTDGVRSVDLPGVRLVLVDSTRPGYDTGTWSRHLDEVVDAAASTDAPVLVAVHHQPMPLPFPTYLPPGVPSPDARRFLDALGQANPRALVITGHTHRHRRHRRGHVTVAEVGSTKDYPGTWGSYEVYEGGIVQRVVRTERPDCIRWTEYTGRAALGAWRRWSPGRLRDRCFTRFW